VGVLDGWRYCPRCGEAIEKAAGRAHCPACGFVAYANPAPTASALVTDLDGRLLLARRAIEPYRGLWDLPGGFLGESEHPLDALRRELREEAGLEIEPRRFVGAWIDRYGDAPDAPWTLNLFWTATARRGVDPRPADDVDELRWFARRELPPPEQLAFTAIADVLAAWKEHA
jgi:ADP-ribose pyrophosphatase YjhB (NUDIX family)